MKGKICLGTRLHRIASFPCNLWLLERQDNRRALGGTVQTGYTMTGYGSERKVCSTEPWQVRVLCIVGRAKS